MVLKALRLYWFDFVLQVLAFISYWLPFTRNFINKIYRMKGIKLEKSCKGS